MAITSGTPLGRYEIISLLGVGGMGEVYLATDTELGRTVALKVLPEELVSDQQRMLRFIQEAKAASGLNHPNIITIYEIGRAGLTPFIATEFIKGVTLRQRMTSGQLSLGEIIDIVTQVAGALNAAHQAGIVHRDIKPENIMVRPDGYIKVLDFGLAKLTEKHAGQQTGSDPEAATVAMLNTTPGILMGTIKYMSPEQARGLPVDVRTDIWSLGVVLYELLTGRLPFEGATSSDMIVSILEREPAPLAQYRPQAPPELAEIVSKALRKHTSERFQAAQDMAARLSRLKRELDFKDNLESFSESGSFSGAQTMITGQPSVSGGGGTSGQLAETNASSGSPPAASASSAASSAESSASALAASASGGAVTQRKRRAAKPKAINSLAIMPLANVGANPETEYLSDGITESIINTLSRLPKLKVMARSTVFRYKGRDIDAQEVGTTLGVSAVLIGRILTMGERFVISTELVNVADGSQLWGAQYKRQISDIFEMQEEIAKEISEKLQLKLSGEERKQLTKRYTENTEAYQLYLKGRYFWTKRTQEGLSKGTDFFRQAIDADPNYALAYTGLADSYAFLGLYRVFPPREVLPAAKAAAAKALQIDDTLAEAHASLAYIKTIFDWDWAGAEKGFKRSLKLNPKNAQTHSFYAQLLAALGRHEEAEREIKRAQELDPLLPIVMALVGYMAFLRRDYDEAIKYAMRTLQIEPNFYWARTGLGWNYEQKGMYEEAIVEYQKGVEITRGGVGTLAALAHGYAVSGRRDEALRIIEELKDESKQRHIIPFDIALVYAGLGDTDAAFEWLEKAYEARFGWLIWLGVEAKWDALRPDPRFADLLRRIGLAT